MIPEIRHPFGSFGTDNWRNTMASLIWDGEAKGPRGWRRARIQFLLSDRLLTVRLGATSLRVAHEWKARIEQLVVDLKGGVSHDGPLVAWLQNLPDEAYGKLARVGLVVPRVREETDVRTLKSLCDAFKGRAAVKASTSASYGQTIDSLTAFFGESRDVSTITPEDADEWRKAVSCARQGEGLRRKRRTTADNTLAPATVAKRVHVAKRIFGKAASWGWLAKNPFAALRAGSQANPNRSHYVDTQIAESVMEACPGPQWRTLVALCRYAGLRCPSEVGLLGWVDVDFHHGRLRVRSPKTEGHGGDHAVRLVPIVPRLRAILADAFDTAASGETLVVPLASRQSANLRTTLTKMIERAHCAPWPRLFQNLRASCETDWVQNYPLHVCAKWLGHSPAIAAQHYVMVRDHHFADAIRGGSEVTVSRGAKCGALVVQTAAQQAPATDTQRIARREKTSVIPEGNSVSPASREELKICSVGDEGLEPPTPSV